MASFYQAHEIVMGHEGGYANHLDDRGGETYKGIARNFHPKWAGWEIIDSLIKGETDRKRINIILQADARLQSLVLSFYKKEFWDELSLDSVNNQEIATELYDTGVNMHTSRSVMFLQSVLNVTNLNGKYFPDIKRDGKIGPITINALNKHPYPKQVVKLLNCLQGARYVDICEANPSQEKFMNSWLSRVVI